MNYYAQGGQAHGLKSLAQELQDYGRGGDTMLAHINPQEAALLKAMGGSGTINPVTGLREYGWFKKATGISTPKFIKGVDDAVIQPIAGAAKDIVKPILPYVQYIAPFIPGVNAAYAAAMGALGSGFAGGGGFNFKRGLMGGMTAYGLSNLYAGMQAAGGATPSISSGPTELGITGTELAPTTVAQTGLTVPPGAAGADIGGQIMSGNFADAASTIGQNIGEGVSSAYNTVTNPNTYANMGDKFATQMSDAGQGLKNLAGLGEGTMADAAKAVGSQFGTGSAMGIYGGVTGAQALDEMDQAKLQADLANAKSKEEYDSIMGRIEASKQRGIAAMRSNPYMFASGGSVDDEVGSDDFNNAGIASMASGGMPEDRYDVDVTDRERRMMFNAQPYAVDMENKMIAGRLGVDYPVGKTGNISAGLGGMAYKTPEGMRARANAMDIGASGRVGPGFARAQMIRDLNSGQKRYQVGYDIPFAEGGMPPRFLSGGGDGMSDDIKATINGNQPARLADGEFVIPADVVSHLGNGSSKAGAKQLYSMMDKVRSARTGTKKQGKQINPAKYMPA